MAWLEGAARNRGATQTLLHSTTDGVSDEFQVASHEDFERTGDVYKDDDRLCRGVPLPNEAVWEVHGQLVDVKGRLESVRISFDCLAGLFDFADDLVDVDGAW